MYYVMNINIQHVLIYYVLCYEYYCVIKTIYSKLLTPVVLELWPRYHQPHHEQQQVDQREDIIADQHTCGDSQQQPH